MVWGLSGVSGGLRQTSTKTPGKSGILPFNLDSDRTSEQHPPTLSNTNSHGHLHGHNRTSTAATTNQGLTTSSPQPPLLYRVILVGDAQAEEKEDELAVGIEDGAGKGSHRHGYETFRAVPTVEVHESAGEGGHRLGGKQKLFFPHHP